jgi:uncharacterized protein YkwD
MRQVLIAIVLLGSAHQALADVAAAINDVRHRGCLNRPGVGTALKHNRRLDAAAKRLAAGEGLHAATSAAGYRELKSASMQMSGVPDDSQVGQMARNQFCAQVTDPDLKEIGTYRSGADVWAILAAPFVPPSPHEAAAISRRILELTNAARASARQCGREPFAAAPPLALSAQLEHAAMSHSRDMAAHGVMDHQGSDGSTPADRVARAGYKWRVIGENLASGVTTADEVVRGWLDSPHHCENIMGPRFTQMGVAYVFNPASPAGIYWTQVFASPRH